MQQHVTQYPFGIQFLRRREMFLHRVCSFSGSKYGANEAATIRQLIAKEEIQLRLIENKEFLSRRHKSRIELLEKLQAL